MAKINTEESVKVLRHELWSKQYSNITEIYQDINSLRKKYRDLNKFKIEIKRDLERNDLFIVQVDGSDVDGIKSQIKIYLKGA